jgi:hypothetical protein
MYSNLIDFSIAKGLQTLGYGKIEILKEKPFHF